MELVIFSDLDGTLLDHHDYAWQAAAPAIAALQEKAMPLVLCSSKTRAEMLPLQRELGISGPLICENGGGVFAPQGHPLAQGGQWQPFQPGWMVWRIGMSIEDLRRRFAEFQGRFEARGFGKMSDAEVAGLTGLNLERAALARQREFNEPLILPKAVEQEAAFVQAAKQAGLQVTKGGRFHHLLGGGDKGKAVRLVSELYRKQYPGLSTMALGDAPNDEPMLAQVDRPVLVARPDGGHAEIDMPGLIKVDGIGPVGWNQAVLEVLRDWGL